MAEETQKTLDLTQSSEDTSLPIEEVKAASSALSKLSRELPDGALKNQYVGKLLLNRIDEYEREVFDLKKYRGSYHEADKRAATLQERLDRNEESIGARGAFSALGGITTGSLFSLWDKPQYFWGMAIVSVILFFLAYIGPALVKWLKNIMK